MAITQRYRAGIMGDTLSVETLHRDSRGVATGGTGDATSHTVTFTSSDIATKKYKVLVFLISVDVQGGTNTNVKFKINDVTKKQYTTDGTSRPYAISYYVPDISASYKIDIVVGSGAGENSTVTNFIVQARVAVFQ